MALALESRRAETAADSRKTTQPVHVWASVGLVATLFQAYVLIRWVTGPYFRRVAPGPSIPPHWMRILIPTYELVSVGLMLCTLYWVSW
jgi:hypothetical protein